jgi:phage minor structural protein
MITLHDPSAERWETNGICVLLPTICDIEEEAGGFYELTMTHPITDDLRALAIQRGYIIKAPVPRMETPLIQISAEGHEGDAEHDVWRVKTGTNLYKNARSGYSAYNSGTLYSVGAKVSYKGKCYQATAATIGVAPTGVGWKKISSPNSTLAKLKADAELIYHGDTGSYSRVTTENGTTGYIKTSRIEYLRTDPYIPEYPSRQDVVEPRQVREQLFRVYSVEADSKGKNVVAKARHISYDLIGNIVKAYNAVDQAPQDALDAMALDLSNDNEFSFYTNLTGTFTGNWQTKNVLECLLDGDEGMVPKNNARLIRDNFDLFILTDEETDRGVYISYGKNLLGIKVTENQAEIITRIMPIGKDADGKRLLLPEYYVDSARIDDYPVPYAKAITYDVEVKDATEDEEEVTEADAYDLLRERAAEEYTKGADLPDITVDVEFVNLGDTAEYAAYKDLTQVFLYDTVHVAYAPMEMAFDMTVTGYTFDAILGRYRKVKLSTKLYKKTATITGDMLSAGSINGTSKIAAGTVDGAALRDYAVKLVHLAASVWPDAPLLENAAVANAVPLSQFVAELALKASAESLEAYETIQNSIARVAVLESSAQAAIAAALAQALDQVSSAKADLDAYKAEVQDYVDWASGTGLRFTYPESPVTTELANDGMRIKYEGATVAAFTTAGTHTPRLVVEDKASFGNATDGYIQFIHTSRGLAIKAGDTI